MEKIVEINSLSKYYSRRVSLFSLEKVQALDGLSLTINKGDIFAILGPNGAGKTTALNIISGLVRQSQGRVKVFGEEFNGQNTSIKSRIGYLCEENILPDYLSLKELLQFLVNIFDLDSTIGKKRVDTLVEQLELKEIFKKRIRLLSSGQKRIASFACTLINEPELLILDEPTVYLDPLAVRNLSRIIINLRNEAKTVILSSHILSQIEKLCNRLAILKQGKLKFSGESKSLLQRGPLDDVFMELTSD